MTFKIGQYVKHVESPKSEVILHLTNEMHVEIVNAQEENFEHSSKEEHDRYWEGEGE